MTETSILLFYQNVIGANSLGKELSSLTISKYCVWCLREHKYEGTSTMYNCQWVLIEHQILVLNQRQSGSREQNIQGREQKYTGGTGLTVYWINI